MPYRVTCTACDYEEVVSALEDVHARTDAHRSETGRGHQMSFELVDEPPLFRGGVSDTWD